MIDVAATGSVGETTAPRAKATGHVQLEHVVAHDGDEHHRHEHEPDGRHREGTGVAAERLDVREEGRRVEQRRQEDEQHEVRVELRLGDAGQDAQHETAEDEHDRVRDADAAGQRVENGDRHEHGGQAEFEAVHDGNIREQARRAPGLCGYAASSSSSSGRPGPGGGVGVPSASAFSATPGWRNTSTPRSSSVVTLMNERSSSGSRVDA